MVFEVICILIAILEANSSRISIYPDEYTKYGLLCKELLAFKIWLPLNLCLNEAAAITIACSSSIYIYMGRVLQCLSLFATLKWVLKVTKKLSTLILMPMT